MLADKRRHALSNAKTTSLAAQALARAAAGARAHVLHPPAVAVRGQLTLVVKAFVISVFEASGNRLATPGLTSPPNTFLVQPLNIMQARSGGRPLVPDVQQALQPALLASLTARTAR